MALGLEEGTAEIATIAEQIDLSDLGGVFLSWIQRERFVREEFAEVADRDG